MTFSTSNPLPGDSHFTTSNAHSTSALAAPVDPQALTTALLSWYDLHKRDLPWRHTTDPYPIWLSEIMLQQTRVETVREYFLNFLQIFPSVSDLARAREEEVLKVWEGLGYYRRARQLHQAAQILVDEYQGDFPRTAKGLQALPGIGPYTAAAIASMAFGEAVPAIDGNLLRIYARMANDHRPIDSKEGRKAAEKFFVHLFATIPSAARLYSSDLSLSGDITSDTKRFNATNSPATSPHPGDLNQALMDLGSLLCLPNGLPLCESCPWAQACQGRQASCAQDLPVRTPKAPRQKDALTVLLLTWEDRVLVRRRPPRGLLSNLYEFPYLPGSLTKEEVQRFFYGLPAPIDPLKSPLGHAEAHESQFWPLGSLEALAAHRHIFTHREWAMTGFSAPCTRQPSADQVALLAQKLTPPRQETAPLLWVSPADLLERYPVPTAFRSYQEAYLRLVEA